MRLRDVRVEYRENPIGLDVRKPRFSWKLDTEEYNTIQTAYQIYITYYDKADKKEIVAWNSGKVESDQSVLVEYSGGALQAETQYKCVIQVWDNHENCATEEVTFETGLLTIENIVAEWITHDVSEEIACPVFVKTFSTKKKVVQARMYATALGLYEITINGQRVGDFYFTPGWTNYHKRLQYQTYDVTKILTTQENHIEITVADGWYKGPFGFTLRPNIYGNRVGALAQLHIAYEDGTEEVVCTDSSWSVTTGQIRYSQIYMGETIDCNCKVNEVFPVKYETAKVLGYVEDAKQYKDLYEDIVEKFNEEYITTTGRMVSETQTGCILALYFDLAEEKYRKRITESLKTNLANHKNHLATGFVGTPYLCHTLTENGLHDLAGTIFLKEDYPSWLYAVKKGATTIWERWNSIMPDGSFDESGMNSLNHYAYGSIGDWMYEKLAGIQLVEPGYKVINIEPQFMKGLTEVDATFESVYGTIRSAWSCKDGKITVDITIPPNTVAYIKLPEKDEVLKVGSGIYHYEYETLSGTYDISVGTSLVDTPLCKEITVIGTVNELGYNQLPTWYVNPTGKPSIQDFEFIYGETIPPFEIEKPGEFTLLNTLNDMKDNVVVQQIIEGMKKGILTTCGGDENSSEYIFTSKLVLNTPLIRLVQQGGGVTPLDVMKMAVDAANGKMMG